eukprot:TRINITY_DN27736_c0_g1_i1.p1 TRINITY_DN27736_c0_g1~~TRINITY_DN27736_c0_g1_i1.p1  ORF type:complete len:719 (+),score=94.39 TRINITY_DN27736_c0_g1_i1:54-2210(+)
MVSNGQALRGVIGAVILCRAASQYPTGTIDQIDCETATCAKYDKWIPAPFENSTSLCKDAQQLVRNEFAAEAPQTCRFMTAVGLKGWPDCRKRYCQVFADVASNLSHMGTELYYSGENDECRPLLNFNQTLCETTYRDAEAFCDCFCPSFHLLNAAGCEEGIIMSLLLGRRGVELHKIWGLNSYCGRFLCDYVATLGEPDPPYPVLGVPDACKKLELPWRIYNCVQLVSRTPYNPEPWLTPVPKDNILECTDGTQHPVDIQHVDTWGVCETHQKRWRCPQNYPIMCKDSYACTGDHCCRQTVEECEGGEARQASPVFALELEEWRGKPNPEMLRRWATTTTMDAYQQFLQRAPTTTIPPSVAQQISEFAWIGIAAFIIAGGVFFVLSCMYMTRTNMAKIRKVVLGPGRLFSVYKSDPVSVFLPSGDLPRDKNRERPLPPVKTAQEMEAERLDAEACAHLEAAWNAALMKGVKHLVHYAGQAEPPQATPLRAAMTKVRARGLSETGKNQEYLQNGDKWLATLEVETMLINTTEEAKPDLRWTAQSRLTDPPIVGKPWAATTMCKIAEGEVRREGWKHIEELRQAIQMAGKMEISPALLEQAKAVLKELIARTPELPSDRCVLDPEGEGIKLLPKGQTRAIWSLTGDAYTYDQQSRQADELDAPLPPRNLLGDVDVDEARPVCAEWAKHARCKAGRKCPWRHVRPKAGDSIRECIIFEDA